MLGTCTSTCHHFTIQSCLLSGSFEHPCTIGEVEERLLLSHQSISNPSSEGQEVCSHPHPDRYSSDMFRIIVILDCEVLEDLEPCEKLGTPCALEDGGPKENGTSAVKKEEDQKPSGGISSNNFYGNKPQPQAQQQRNLPTRTGGPSSSHGNIYPIEALSPYAHKWTIKARCTHKGDIRTWHKNTGEGKLFSCNFLDESGEIRATAFNDQVDTLHPIIQEGGVYYVSTPCSVKFTNRKFNNLPHEYELTFDRDTVVEKCEDQESAPKVKFNLINIEDIQNVEKDSTIDTIGVLKDVGNTEQITSKTTGKPFDKRDLTIVDETCHSIRLTIWGNTATNFEVPEGSVIAFKGARVSDFNGKSLSLLSSGSMSADPQMDEAYRLKGWYDAQGNSENFKTHAAVLGSTGGGGRSEDYKTVAQVKEEQLGMSESADFFTLKATVMFIHPDRVIAYAACPSPDHNNKVIEDEGQGLWRCERCNRTYPAPQWRYVFGANVSDWTGSFWISCFDDTGKLVFGRDAEHVQKLKEEDEGAYKTLLNEVTNTTLMFKCRAKQDNFQDTVG